MRDPISPEYVLMSKGLKVSGNGPDSSVVMVKMEFELASTGRELADEAAWVAARRVAPRARHESPRNRALFMDVVLSVPVPDCHGAPIPDTLSPGWILRRVRLEEEAADPVPLTEVDPLG